MSVIQEALRRKMVEQADQSGPQPADTSAGPGIAYQEANPPPRHPVAPQVVYPPSPSSQASPRNHPSPNNTQRATSWFVMLFLLLVAGGAVALFFVQSRQVASSRSVPVQELVVLENPPAETVDANGNRVFGEEVDELAVQSKKTDQVAAASAGEPVAPKRDVKHSGRSRAIAAKQDTVTRDDWPKIELMGILAGGESGRSTAILNGALVMLDASMDGVTLADVGEDGVYLEFKGDRQYIRIGEHTR